MIAYTEIIFVSPRLFNDVEQLFGKKASEALAYSGLPNIYVDNDGKICTYNREYSYFNGWFVFRTNGKPFGVLRGTCDSLFA